MTNPKLFDTGEEYAIKNGLDGDTFIIGLFNRSQNQLSDNDNLGDINSEPNGGAYSRQTSTFSSFDADDASTDSTQLTADWAVSNDSEIEFDVSDSTNTVDAYFIAKNFQSVDEANSSPQTNIISTGLLERVIDLSGGNLLSEGDNVLTITLSADQIGIRFGVKVRGNKLIVAGAANNRIYRHNLNTEYDTSTLVFNELSFDTSFTPLGTEFDIIGSKFYTIESDGTIYQYQLRNKYDISTAQLMSSTSVNLNGRAARDIKWNDDGTKLFVVEDSGTDGVISEYNASTAFDISSILKNTDISYNGGSLGGLCWNKNGKKLYFVAESGGGTIREISLNTAFSISTVSSTFESNRFVQQGTTGGGGTPGGIAFNNDGTKFYEVTREKNKIAEVTLSSPFSLSTNTNVDVVNMFDGSPAGIVFNTSPKYIGKD